MLHCITFAGWMGEQNVYYADLLKAWEAFIEMCNNHPRDDMTYDERFTATLTLHRPRMGDLRYTFTREKVR